LQIEVLSDIPEDPDLRQSWNRLAMQMTSPEVFYTYEWARAVCTAYRGSLQPTLFLAREGRDLVALGSLASDVQTGRVSFLAGNTADYCDFLSASERRAEFVQAVLRELENRGTSRIMLTNLPAGSATIPALDQLPASPYHLHRRTAYDCARVVFDSQEDREKIRESIVARKRVRRNIRELEKRGSVSVRHDGGWDEIEPLLHAFSAAHVARFLQTGRISNLVRKQRRDFLYVLARQLSPAGWIVLSRLFVGDTAIAWNYGFCFAGSWFWYQPTINGAYRDFSPGYCLLAKIVERACESPEVSVVDLGLGAEEYKERFATATRETLYCELNLSLADHLRTEVRSRAAAFARKSPAVENRLRGLRDELGKLVGRLRTDGARETAGWALRRAWTSAIASDEVLFFEASSGGHEGCFEANDGNGSSASLQLLDAQLLGEAAMIYADDPATLAYLIRSAERLRSGAARGFVLVSQGRPVHFCWLADFEGFEIAELGQRLQAPCREAVMIFDCYTPASARGNAFFAQAIRRLAEHAHREGKSPWIFSAATNLSSRRGIGKAGFAHRYSLWRKRLLFAYERRGRQTAASPETAPRAVSA